MAPGESPENVPIRMAELGVDKYDHTTDKYLIFNKKLGAHSAVWAQVGISWAGEVYKSGDATRHLWRSPSCRMKQYA